MHFFRMRANRSINPESGTGFIDYMGLVGFVAIVALGSLQVISLGMGEAYCETASGVAFGGKTPQLVEGGNPPLNGPDGNGPTLVPPTDFNPSDGCTINGIALPEYSPNTPNPALGGG